MESNPMCDDDPGDVEIEVVDDEVPQEAKNPLAERSREDVEVKEVEDDESKEVEDDDAKEVEDELPKKKKKKKKEILEVLELSEDQMKRLMHFLYTHKDSWPYRKPVDPKELGIPDYFDVIKEPMDLGTIKNRLYDSKRRYRNDTESFLRDVRLVWANAKQYNPEDTWIYGQTVRMGSLFEDRLSRMVKKRKVRLRESREAPGDYERRTSSRLASGKKAKYVYDSEDSELGSDAEFLRSSSDDEEESKEFRFERTETHVRVDKMLDHRRVGELSQVQRLLQEKKEELEGDVAEIPLHILRMHQEEQDAHYDTYDPDVEYEYLIKWQRTSYLHLEWVHQDVLHLEGNVGKGKIQRYWKNLQKLKDNRLIYSEDGTVLHDPEFLDIDRILAWKRLPEDQWDPVVVERLAAPKAESDNGTLQNDHSSKSSSSSSSTSTSSSISTSTSTTQDDSPPKITPENKKMEVRLLRQEMQLEQEEETLQKLRDSIQNDPKPDLMYLVKWMNQTHEEATWEYPSALGYDAKIADFHAYCMISLNGNMTYKRPPAENWTKLHRSPHYRNNMRLRSYQLEGLNWLIFSWYHRRSSILADEMGLGKTVQVISFLEHLRRQEHIPGPFLVICPLSTLGHWQREIQTWTTMNVVVYQGTRESRAMIRQFELYAATSEGQTKNYRFHILLTTYEMFLRDDWQELQRIRWRVLVVDEAQRLKNTHSRLLERLRLCTSEHRVLLTGTPLQNNTQELWTLLNFIEPSRFVSLDAFTRDFGTLTSASQVHELQRLLRPHLLRRMKEDVEKDIPPKEEIIVEIELTNFQKQYYRAILEGNRGFLNKGCRANNVPNLMNIVMELRKVCCHPFLIKGVEDKECNKYGESMTWAEYHELLVRTSAKFVLLDKLLPKLEEQGHRVLIFSQMVRVLDLLELYIRGKGYKHERIDGGIRGTLRQAAIDRFVSPDSDRFIFLLCTRAGGVGINLATADTVIIFDSDWNPQNDIQAQARAHRIGQKSEVKVYRLLTAKTYEKRMFERTSKKLGLDQAVLHNLDNWGASSTTDEVVTGLQKSSRTRLVAKEIDQLLKTGAYDLYGEDTKEQEITDEDIEAILGRSKVVQYDKTAAKPTHSINFSKAVFQTSEVGVDMDDENFWEKILPEEKTAAVLLDHVTTGEAFDSDESVESFWNSLQEIVEDALERWDRGRFAEVPQNLDVLATVLEKVAMEDAYFTKTQLTMAEDWKERVQAPLSRRRSRRTTDRYGEGAAKSEAQSSSSNKSRRTRSNAGSFSSDEEVEPQVSNSRKGSRRGLPIGYIDQDAVVTDSSDEDGEGKRAKVASLRSRGKMGQNGNWTRAERNRFIDAFLSIGPQRMDMVRKKAKLDDIYSVAEVTQLAEDWLTQCFYFADEEDELVFEVFLEDLLGNVTWRDALVSKKEKYAAAGKNPFLTQIQSCLAEVPFQDQLRKKNKAWAKRMKVLLQLEDVLKRGFPKEAYELPRLRKRVLTPWWTIDHNYDLVHASAEYGISCYDEIWADTKYCFHNFDFEEIANFIPTSSKNQNSGPSSTWPSPRILNVHLKYILDSLDRSAAFDVSAKDLTKKEAILHSKRLVKQEKSQEEKEAREQKRLEESQEKAKKREQEKLEKEKLREEKREEELALRRLQWSKKERQSFRSAIMCYGPHSSWERLLKKANLEKYKTAEILEKYYEGLLVEIRKKLGPQTLSSIAPAISSPSTSTSTSATKVEEEADDEDQDKDADDDAAEEEEGDDVEDDIQSVGDDEDGGDASKEMVKKTAMNQDVYQLTLKMASRLDKRIRLWNDLVEKVLPHEQRDERLRRCNRGNMPIWWATGGRHDKVLLQAVVKLGLSGKDEEWEQYLANDECPFYTVPGRKEVSKAPIMSFLQTFIQDRSPLLERLRAIRRIVITPPPFIQMQQSTLFAADEMTPQKNATIINRTQQSNDDEEKKEPRSTAAEKREFFSPFFAAASSTQASQRKVQPPAVASIGTASAAPMEDLFSTVKPDNWEEKLRRVREMQLREKVERTAPIIHLPPTPILAISNHEATAEKKQQTAKKKKKKNQQQQQQQQSKNNNNPSSSGSDEDAEWRPSNSPAATAASRKRTRTLNPVSDDEYQELVNRPAKRQRTPRDIPREVARDTNGDIVFPIYARGANVYALGEVNWESSKFHSKNYIWPVGFRSVRKMGSLRYPEQQVTLTSEIREENGAPLFIVTAQDGPDTHAWHHHTASGVWQQVLRQLKRRTTVSVSGPEMYGFADPTVQSLIQDLPNAGRCEKYIRKNWEPLGGSIESFFEPKARKPRNKSAEEKKKQKKARKDQKALEEADTEQALAIVPVYQEIHIPDPETVAPVAVPPPTNADLSDDEFCPSDVSDDDVSD